jgi:hypothetical protein
MATTDPRRDRLAFVAADGAIPGRVELARWEPDSPVNVDALLPSRPLRLSGTRRLKDTHGSVKICRAHEPRRSIASPLPCLVVNDPTDGKASLAERRERRSLGLARPDRNRLTPKSSSMSGDATFGNRALRRSCTRAAARWYHYSTRVKRRGHLTPDDRKGVTACNWYPASSHHAQRQPDHKSAAHDCHIMQASHTCISYPIHHSDRNLNPRASHISRTALFRNPTLAWYFPSST